MDANELMAPIHDRMPVILDGERLGSWLDRGVEEVDELRGLFESWSSDGWEAYPVSERVNAPSNDGPELVEPVG